MYVESFWQKMYIYVVIFVKDIWSRDRAIYDRAPKTVPKYFDLHTLIYIEVEQGQLCEVNGKLYRKNASELCKDESALRRWEEHLCDSSFGVHTRLMP